MNILVEPPDMAFLVLHEERGFTARQQVRAIHGLSQCLRAKEALPFFVMHTEGPSLTQSSASSAAIQLLSGRAFGAGFMVEGDNESIMAWWNEHKSEYAIALDYLVQHLVRLAENKFVSKGAIRSEGLWCAVMRLERAQGDAKGPPGDATVEVLRARLGDMETEWLQRGCK